MSLSSPKEAEAARVALANFITSNGVWFILVFQVHNAVVATQQSQQAVAALRWYARSGSCRFTLRKHCTEYLTFFASEGWAKVSKACDVCDRWAWCYNPETRRGDWWSDKGTSMFSFISCFWDLEYSSDTITFCIVYRYSKIIFIYLINRRRRHLRQIHLNRDWEREIFEEG
jgi:hypothetical protein